MRISDWSSDVCSSDLLDMDNPLSTDKAMAWNSTNYKGGSGNFVDTYQSTAVGSVVMREESPALELLSAATRGVVARSEERRVGKEWVRTCRSQVAPDHVKKNNNK